MLCKEAAVEPRHRRIRRARKTLGSWVGAMDWWILKEIAKKQKQILKERLIRNFQRHSKTAKRDQKYQLYETSLNFHGISRSPSPGSANLHRQLCPIKGSVQAIRWSKSWAAHRAEEVCWTKVCKADGRFCRRFINRKKLCFDENRAGTCILQRQGSNPKKWSKYCQSHMNHKEPYGSKILSSLSLPATTLESEVVVCRMIPDRCSPTLQLCILVRHRLAFAVAAMSWSLGFSIFLYYFRVRLQIHVYVLPGLGKSTSHFQEDKHILIILELTHFGARCFKFVLKPSSCWTAWLRLTSSSTGRHWNDRLRAVAFGDRRTAKASICFWLTYQG